MNMIDLAHTVCGIEPPPEPVAPLKERLEANWKECQIRAAAKAKAQAQFDATGDLRYHRAAVAHQDRLCRLAYEFGQMIEELER